jgi:hypothetical protein
MAGRPTKYKQEYNEQAYELCLLGYTDKELAGFFDTSEVTLNAWKKKYPEFLKSLREGKDVADGKVAKSFYKRALGYKYDEITKEPDKEKLKVTKVITKEQAPDAGAALSWLKNRQPDKWRDKKDVEHHGDIRFIDNWDKEDEGQNTDTSI